MGGARHNRCCTPVQMSDAGRVADQLGIPFYVLDTKQVFRDTVVQYYINKHRDGVTPNPCLECNRKIRFDWLLNNALALDADYLATGHYARVSRDIYGRWQLRRGYDARKDQSYVLSVLGQEQLARTMFPIGAYPKAEVRALAAELGLHAANRKDSQDLCFLGNGDYRDFLQMHAPDIMKPGPIVSTAGEILGEHQGLANYTIGQRKGLGISHHEPLFVLEMNPFKQALVVGTRDQLGRDRLIADGVNWIAGRAPVEPRRFRVKIRYQAQPQPAWVEPLKGSRIHVAFDEPPTGYHAGPGGGAVSGRHLPRRRRYSQASVCNPRLISTQDCQDPMREVFSEIQHKRGGSQYIRSVRKKREAFNSPLPQKSPKKPGERPYPSQKDRQ